jgi:hypothetical protein
LNADLSDWIIFLDAVERVLGELDRRIAHAIHKVVVVDIVVTAGPVVSTTGGYFA